MKWNQTDDQNLLRYNACQKAIKRLIPGLTGGGLYHAINVIVGRGSYENLREYLTRNKHIQRPNGTWTSATDADCKSLFELTKSYGLTGARRSRYLVKMGALHIGA